MFDPNKILSEALRKRDQHFRELENRLQQLENDYTAAADESQRERILKQMLDVRERVDARISYARSA